MEKAPYKKIFIKKGRRDSLDRKHPWIFSGAILDSSGFQDGELVQVIGPAGISIGTGYFQNASIMVRMLSFDDVCIDEVFWIEKITKALQMRRVLGIPSEDTDCYRLIHGEGDGIPGLVVDIYADVAVIQAHTIGIYLLGEGIGAALEKVFHYENLKLDSIYFKSESALPLEFARQVQDRFLKGKKSHVITRENGHLFEIGVVEGQKTGFFIDQRDNRLLLSRYAKGKSVLNLFSYTGGFSLYALAAGAVSVVSVDVSKKAIEALNSNLERNGLGVNHRSETMDVLEFLKREKEEKFDIVVTDPPAFAKSIHKRHNAVQAYKRVNILSLNKVKPGGLLFSFSCSQVIDQALFYNTITAAAIESGRECRVLHLLSQGPDHPVSLNHPEGKYLKGLVLYVEN